MRIKNKALYIFGGVILGIIIGVSFIDLTDKHICPDCNTATDSGIKVIPISDRGFFPVVHKSFKNAQKTIYIIAFELKYYEKFKGSSENVLVEDLIEAKKRGVDIKIIVDEYSNRNNAYKYLRENGIDIKHDPQNTTTHAKLIIIDGEIIILGSTNLSYYGLEKNYETDIYIKSKKIAEYFIKYFWELWKTSD